MLATDTYPKEETIRRERSEEAMDAVVVTEGASSESSEQNDDDRRAQQRPFAGEMVTSVAKEEHADDGSSESDGGDIGLGS